MNDCHNTNPQYTSVLASFTHENGGCIEDSLHPHSLENEANFTSELVEMEELTIVTPNGHVSGRLSSRIISEDLGSITTPKTLELDPEDLLQQNCHIEEQPLSFKSNSVFNHVNKPTKWKEIQLEGSRLLSKKHDSMICPKVVDTSHSHDVLSTNTDMNNVINLSSSKLPLQSTNNTAVEQPNVGPCSCFICGQHLIDPGERYSYMKNQKLFSMKVSLLQLLSDIVNQTVITNTDSIDLCPKCSELMNEVDITYKHLNDLKEEITKLFAINKRPKLTFHILPKPSSAVSKNNYLFKKPVEVNLSELAYTRPRRGRGSKKRAIIKDKTINQMLENEKPVKKKGGRPRKPFQCHICKRKFLTQSMNDKHLIKEHNVRPNNTARLPLLQSVNTNTSLPISLNSNEIVKQENTEEDKDNNSEKSENSVSERKPELFSLLQQSTASLPSVSRFNSFNCSTSGGQSTVRPIQPKPQTVIHTGVDGSLMFFMNPTTSEASPTLIKVSPGYLNLKTGAHTCELCQKTFLDDKGYKMHKIAAHGVRKRKLEYEENSTKVVSLDKKDEAHQQKYWQCDLCSVMFTSKKQLSDHKKLSHENNFKGSMSRDIRKDKIYSCEDCEQIFNYKYEMESHRETHLPFNQVGPHEFVCCLCGLKVASKAALKIHLHRFHNKEEETKDFLCAECGYMTGTKKAFSDHLRVHNENPGQKKECHLCQKEMRPSSYKIHMLRMHGEAKYPCETCGQRFTVRSDLMKHLNTIHSSLRPYDCVLCGEKFVTSEALRYHKNKVHSSVFHFCEVCGKSYKWKGELRTHMNRCHNEAKARYHCSLCSRSYADRRKLCHHMTNKHNAPKEITCIRKQCQEKQMPRTGEIDTDEMTVDEIVSSTGYEPQGALISSPQIAMTSESRSTQSEVQIPVVTGDESTLTTLHTYDNGSQQTSLTTLHSQMPLHQPHIHNNPHTHHHHELQRSFSHHEDGANASISHYTHSHIHHPSTSQTLLSHQPLNAALIPLEPKGQQQEHLTHAEVQSIYLVPDMQTAMQQNKTVPTS